MMGIFYDDETPSIDGTPPAFWRGFWIHDASIDETTPSFIMPVVAQQTSETQLMPWMMKK